jgi:ubiquitin C-terminal hydrolase
VLEGAEDFSCVRCKAKGAGVTKRLRVRRWPRVLVLHLKRFQWGATGPRNKLNNTVDLPAEISLAPFLTEDAAATAATAAAEGGSTDDAGPRYRLFGIAHHMGSMGGGHYTASCDAGGRGLHSFTFQLNLTRV